MKLFVSSFVVRLDVKPIMAAGVALRLLIDLHFVPCSIDWAKSAEQLAKPANMHSPYLFHYFYSLEM